jgi:hypothetical protein
MILFLQSETLWSILCSPAHWIAEIVITVLIDGVLLGLFWPVVRNCWLVWRGQDWAKRVRATDEQMLYNFKNSAVSTHCDKPRVHLDTSVDICTGCGDVKVAPSRKSMDTYGARNDY